MNYDLAKYVPQTQYSVKHPNTLHDWLHFLFLLHRPVYDLELRSVLRKYKVGSTKNEEAILWYIDRSGVVIDGLVKNYYPNDTPPTSNGTISERLGMHPRELCLYGEHLLTECTNSPVAIVADEVTAIFMACVYPAFTWVSCDTDMIPSTADLALAGFKVIIANGGDGGTWKRFLRDSKVIVRPDIVDIANKDFAPFYDEYLREYNRGLGERIDDDLTKLKNIIFNNQRRTNYEVSL